MTLNLFLWSAFCINIVLFLIAVLVKSDALMLCCLLISLLIIMMHSKHQRFYTIYKMFPDCLTGQRFSFFNYLKKVFSNTSLEESELSKSSLIKTSIDFSVNPDSLKSEFLIHSFHPAVITKKDFNVRIGSKQLEKPFYSNILNLDIPDYALLSKEMLIGLDRASQAGNFAYAAKEYELFKPEEASRILKFPLNKGHELCRNATINEQAFLELSSKPYLKAIELYLDSSFSTCYSLSEMMGKKMNSYFNSIPELLNFIQELRKVANDKPIGIRIAIKKGKQNEFIELCKAMREKEIELDFISIMDERSSKLTGSNDQYLDFEYAVSFASNTLKRFQLDQEVKIIAAGPIDNGFELLKFLSLGASSCMAVKPIKFFMDSSDHYFNEDSPSFLKSRILNIHRNIVREAIQLMEYAGFDKIEKIDPKMFFRKGSHSTIKNFEEIYFKENIYQSEVINKNFMYN